MAHYAFDCECCGGVNSSSVLNLGNDERLLIRKSWVRLAELMREKAKVDTPTGQQLVSDVFYTYDGGLVVMVFFFFFIFIFFVIRFLVLCSFIFGV
jgi:hypothetical protein